MYCHADDHEPGIGDRGERHLIQLWPAQPTDPVHPPISDEDLQARTEYATAMARQTAVHALDDPEGRLVEYGGDYTVHLRGDDLDGS
ncbi:hypothetical protein ACWDZ8_35540 [Streptomyces sp. NPDC003233]